MFLHAKLTFRIKSSSEKSPFNKKKTIITKTTTTATIPEIFQSFIYYFKWKPNELEKREEKKTQLVVI